MGKVTFDFSGQVAVITGAARGIGKGAAEAFAEAGASVYLLDIDGERGAAAMEAIRGRGGQARFLVCDVTDSASVQRAFESILAEAARIDILVNNAGGWTKQQSTADTPEEEWDRIISVNLKGVFLCAKAVIPAFRRQKSGCIVNMGSLGGLTTYPNSTSSPPYVVSKAGVHSFTRVLASELGRDGVVVNALAPSTTATERVLAVRSDEQRARIAASNLVGRIAEVKEIVSWILFLASPEARYLTGQTISVNGGRLMV
jgi:NAD(P)-dependent dehydrogenase (short-subunit alcohol dehydrogenase family)